MIKFQELKITPDGQNLIVDVSIKDFEYYNDVYLDKLLIDTSSTFIDSGPSSKAIEVPLTKREVIVVKPEDFIENAKDEYYTYKYHLKEGAVYNFYNIQHFDDLANVQMDSFSEMDLEWTAMDIKGKEFLCIKTTDGYEQIEISIPEYSVKDKKVVLNIKDLGISKYDNLLIVYAKAKGIPSANTPCGMDNNIVMGIAFNCYLLYRNALNYIMELSDNCSISKNFINFILQYKVFELAIKAGHYTEAIKYWKKFFMRIKDAVITPNCGCYGQGT